MSITDNERVEIFGRIGQLEGARSNEASHIKSAPDRDTSNGGGAKAFASVLVILAVIGGMAAIVRPMQQQTDFLAREVAELQTHASDGHPARVEAEVNRVVNRLHLNDEDVEKIEARTNKLEQKVSVLTQQMKDGTKDRYYGKDATRDKEIIEQKIINMENQIQNFKELIKDANIFPTSN